MGDLFCGCYFCFFDCFVYYGLFSLFVLVCLWFGFGFCCCLLMGLGFVLVCWWITLRIYCLLLSCCLFVCFIILWICVDLVVCWWLTVRVGVVWVCECYVLVGLTLITYCMCVGLFVV